MPVYIIKCPNCEHQFKGLVMANTQEPKEWVCSQCGSRQAKPIFQYSSEHPWKILTEQVVHVAAALANNKILHNLGFLLKIYID